jgi:23S rRNA (guanosine2251-2'-O)-methyltransferase
LRFVLPLAKVHIMRHSSKDSFKASINPYWIYGRHACLAAIANPSRTIRQILLTRSAYEEMLPALGGTLHEVVDVKHIEKRLSPDAVHQGVAMEVLPLAQPELDEIVQCGKPLLLLDQVTDPHNVGAVLRSAAAFDAGAVIVHDRNAPKESGIIAKTASGALEHVPLVTVGNIATAMKEVQDAGYWCIGLDGEAKGMLHTMKLDAKTVLVLGAEGAGMRRLTAERCDHLVKLPIHPQMESLNVSNAAAIALYEVYKMTSAMAK